MLYLRMNVLQQIGHTMKSVLYATFFVYVMLAAAPPRQAKSLRQSRYRQL